MPDTKLDLEMEPAFRFAVASVALRGLMLAVSPGGCENHAIVVDPP